MSEYNTIPEKKDSKITENEDFLIGKISETLNHLPYNKDNIKLMIDFLILKTLREISINLRRHEW